MKALIASLLVLLSAMVSASPVCPSAHFQPATYYGQAFFDSSPVTEYELLSANEDVALQIIEYQTFEPGYVPVFTTSLLRAESGQYRAALVRAQEPKNKGGKPVTSAAFRELPAALAARAVASAALVLRNTRYPNSPCTEDWLDGYVVQAFVPNTQGFGDLVGEVYVPPAESEAGAIVSFGRALRSYVEGKGTVQELESAVLALERHNKSFKPKPLRGSA